MQGGRSACAMSTKECLPGARSELESDDTGRATPACAPQPPCCATARRAHHGRVLPCSATPQEGSARSSCSVEQLRRRTKISCVSPQLARLAGLPVGVGDVGRRRWHLLALQHAFGQPLEEFPTRCPPRALPQIEHERSQLEPGVDDGATVEVIHQIQAHLPPTHQDTQALPPRNRLSIGAYCRDSSVHAAEPPPVTPSARSNGIQAEAKSSDRAYSRVHCIRLRVYRRQAVAVSRRTRHSLRHQPRIYSVERWNEGASAGIGARPLVAPATHCPEGWFAGVSIRSRPRAN